MSFPREGARCDVNDLWSLRLHQKQHVAAVAIAVVIVLRVVVEAGTPRLVGPTPGPTPEPDHPTSDLPLPSLPIPVVSLDPLPHFQPR